MGTALDSISIVGGLFVVALCLLVFYKYTIDTRATINELKQDRDLYRQFGWQNFIKSSDSEKRNSVVAPAGNNFVYDNLKNKISLLISDLQETDFESFPDIKIEVISALKDIDSYGEANDKD